MKTRTVLLLLAFCAFAVASYAKDLNEGKWKLNVEKSNIAAGASQNSNVVYTAEGDKYKCVVDGVEASGAPLHNEWTGKFDGKDYPVIGDPASDTRAVEKVDARHYKLTSKKDGKTTITGTIEFSPDGKTRTLVVNTTDAEGKKLSSTFVYDRE